MLGVRVRVRVRLRLRLRAHLVRVRVRARLMVGVRVGVRVRVRVRARVSFCTRTPRSCTAAAFAPDLAGPEIVSAGPEMPRHRLELTSKRRTW